MNDLDRYLDRFGRTLEEAAHAADATPARRRRRLLVLLAGPVALAAITAVLLLLPGGQTTRRLDVIAEARAALQPQAGQLTHLVVRQRIAPTPGRRGSVTAPPITSEQWSATGPVRWRITYINPSNVRPHPGDRVESAYADGVEEDYDRRRNRLRRVTGLGVHSAPAAYPLGTDPVATLRSMLAQGKLRDAGTTKIGDRDVRRFLGSRTRRFGDVVARGSVEYFVDPQTFAPVRARFQPPLPQPVNERLFVVLDFQTFERLPLTAESAELLEIHPDPGVAVREIRARRP